MSNLPVRSSENTRWAPFILPWDDAPIDISHLFEDEKPAGKRGFLKVNGDKMFFEDGTEARFWGTCFNSAANFPSHEQSKMVARRLAKFGVNIMRCHQMDAEWSTPNIFQFTRGQRRDDSRSLDPTSMDRFDYLVYCLKEEGIYTYLDLLTYRRFKPGDGVDSPELLGPAAKPYCCFDRKLIELQKEFNAQIWNHVNPYTGLAYKDDPAIVMTEIANEADPFVYPPQVEPYRTRLEEMYRKWADERDITLPVEKVDFTSRTSEMMHFFRDLMADYYKEMYDHLREIGVKIPIDGNNWEAAGFPEVSASECCDFRDNHVYWDMWSDVQGNNLMMLAQKEHNWAKSCARARLLDRPFVISEWDQVWPNEWRAESPLMLAALAAFQEWSGIIIHTYRYRSSGPIDKLGAVVMYGVGYRVNFDTFNDPAKFGLFYHAALLYRLGHVSPAKKTVALRLEDKDLFAPKRFPTPALAILSEQHKAGVILPGQDIKVDIEVKSDDPEPEVKPDIKSDTGELCRNPKWKFGWIDTPKTKVFYGLIGGREGIELAGLKLKVKTPFAVIAISSLDGEPIENSANMLVTAVGRVDNSNARYNDDHTRRFSVGEAPTLMEVIEADIELTTSQPHLRVFPIDEEGFMKDHSNAEIVDGVAKFSVGGKYPSIYYLLQRIG